ncbi:MAG TPA: GTP-binding protein [Cyanobacteria bacterium UBA11149]|nr:GTP-binding protein [Cyanobacteria bacterium UBA11367]HBE60145.1 GTP-binding protein [Cyanobacteria bacterium UBA11366]HBK64814.1 GTP-binding protein [Cyanobacteria bacterium UBA11166]HBS70703.1 GTP-binding protein [Cyanobacteria bacterium UBA11153]HBW90395.1 GTP-binding protein [Cyanobacteria bacterium UBA11149]HCA93165.1 GTP-binding protein [Cyanobacteria bacterium UBA9226]
MLNTRLEIQNRNDFSFFEAVENQFLEIVQDFSKTLNIAIIGKKGVGKSSLIQALMKRISQNKSIELGNCIEVNPDLKIFKLDKRVKIIESLRFNNFPENISHLTRELFKPIDLGILVVNGVANESDKQHFEDLKKHCDSIFVVWNKIDDWDSKDPGSLEKAIADWQDTLESKKIYPISTFGYQSPHTTTHQIAVHNFRLLQENIENILDGKGKTLLMARHTSHKKYYAKNIVAKALISVAIQAFLPENIAYITATQTSALVALYYLYTGQIISLKYAITILSDFALVENHQDFVLFITSLLPSAGLVNIESSGIKAMTITLAMLATVNSLLAGGVTLPGNQRLQFKFRPYKKRAEDIFKTLKARQLGDLKLLKNTIEPFIA